MLFPSLCSAALLLAVSLQDPAAAPVQAEWVLRGGKVVTVDPDVPDGTALAMRGGRILAVGSDEDIAPHVGEDTNVIELEGRLAIPGFIEGHAHFLGIGTMRTQLDLTGACTWNEIVAMVADAVRGAEPGELIQGRGWHQEKWDETPEGAVDGLPTHHSLSEVSPHNPVILTHASGHATFANRAAMRICGIDGDTPAPDGGEIIHSLEGLPIGVFRETASSLLNAARMRAKPASVERLANLAQEECLRKGVTSFQDAGTTMDKIAALGELADAGQLHVRLWMMIRDDATLVARQLPKLDKRHYGPGFLTVGGIKHSIDGALGAHGAWLLEPYEDLPSSSGLNTVPVRTIEASAKLCAEQGLQLCIHAIGDRAARETLDIFERAYAAFPQAKQGRWRVEHAQHLHPDDIPRFAELGAIASMQAVHCTSDGPWVPRRLGEKRAKEGAYVWRSLIDSGAVVTNGTDAPVEDVDPLPAYHAAVTRQLSDGSSFYAEQCMTREEALASYTLWAAYAAFEEQEKGSLTPGKLADVVVLSQDILTVPEDQILDTKVDLTFVGGVLRYRR